MIPRANRYRLPHRKADGRIQCRASPVGTGARRPRVCSPGRPEKWISWGAPAARSFFRGEHLSPGRRPPRICRLRRMRYTAISVSLRIIRKCDYRNPRTSRFRYRHGGLLKATECLLLTLAHRFPRFRATRGMLTSIIALYVTQLYAPWRNFSL